MKLSENQVREIRKKFSAKFLANPSVRALTVEDNLHYGFCLVVYLIAPEAQYGMPDILDGCRVIYNVSGEISERAK